MSTNENTKNPNIILDEITKRLNRVQGGSRLFSLNEAITLAKADHSKVFECFSLIKTNLVKFKQPTAAANALVLEIVEIIDNYTGYLSLDEISSLKSTNEIILPKLETKSEDDDQRDFIIVTEELLDENPEIAVLASIGDKIAFDVESDTIDLVVTQEFIDAHPEIAGEVEVDDIITFSKIQEGEEFDELMESSEEELEETVIAPDAPVDDIEKDKSFPEFLSKLSEKVKQPAKSIAVGITATNEADEKLEVTASKTFDGVKTKVTKKLISAHKELAGAQIGSFVYIDDNKVTASLIPGKNDDEDFLSILDVPIILE